VRRALLVALLVPLALTGTLQARGDTAAVNGRIAYERHGFSGGAEVWTMRQDGSDLRRLSRGGQPAWSPDGTRLVLVADQRLMIVGAEGGEATPLNIVGDPEFGPSNPVWSPDGALIAFSGGDGLYVVPAGGGAARLLVSSPQQRVSWSPDGAQLAFVAQDGAVTVVNRDGSERHALPGTHGRVDAGVSWSPDGTRIAFFEESGGLYRLSTVGHDGAPPVTLVRDTAGSDPAWSPDGTRIAFTDSPDICVAGADGSGLGRLTYAAYDDVRDNGGLAQNVAPAWQPLPPGSPPAGLPIAPSGPPADWDRSYSWGWACPLVAPNDLALTGTATPSRISTGGVTTFRLAVENRGDVPIGAATLVALRGTLDGGARVVSAAATRGRCWTSPGPDPEYPPLALECHFGSLFPDESVAVTLRLRATAPGELALRVSLPRTDGEAPDRRGPRPSRPGSRLHAARDAGSRRRTRLAAHRCAVRLRRRRPHPGRRSAR
jgi:hypothetical protein